MDDMISMDAYLKMVRFRYSVARFECADPSCNHSYYPSGNELPSQEMVVAHLMQSHMQVPA